VEFWPLSSGTETQEIRLVGHERRHSSARESVASHCIVQPRDALSCRQIGIGHRGDAVVAIEHKGAVVLDYVDTKYADLFCGRAIKSAPKVPLREGSETTHGTHRWPGEQRATLTGSSAALWRPVGDSNPVTAVRGV
jgi:hypothetical protein